MTSTPSQTLKLNTSKLFSPKNFFILILCFHPTLPTWHDAKLKSAQCFETIAQTFYLLSLTGAQGGESALKADALLTHDLHSFSNFQTQNSKAFLSEKLFHFDSLFPPNSANLTRCETKECSMFWDCCSDLLPFVSYWCARRRVSFKSQCPVDSWPPLLLKLSNSKLQSFPLRKTFSF